uniref:Reverse transcriptase domain-containing protein n=1 Tax=Tanacetum cinerariifolium TaxID=118510 RepID=A0A6L2MMX9_TANCI|nr:reverse transcriptase domain-containing protein [Tanacetum cinerariifolium]
MRTCSSLNLVGESSPNLTISNPKRRNRRRSKQPFILKEYPVDTMADQRTMAELLHAPTEGYAKAIVVPPILTEHFEFKHSLINMITSDQFFRLEKDNPDDHISTVNYNQGNSGYRPPRVANQIRPTGFAQPNVQNNQNRFSQPQGYNRGNNFIEDTSYQASIQQNKVVPLTLLSNKEKLLELENTPLNENCSAVILKKLPEKLGDPGKFLISCGFSELKCKAIADLGSSINLRPLSVWKNLGLPELISTRMTLELANRAIYTPARMARDVFVLVEEFTFPVDFVIIDYERDPHWQSHFFFFWPFARGFADELALITFPPGNDNLSFDNESDLREIEYLLNNDPTKEMDSILEDSIDESNLAYPNNNLVDTILEMFTNEHTLDYSSLPLYDDVDNDLVELESDDDDVYDDPFDSKENKSTSLNFLLMNLIPLDQVISFLPPNKKVKKISISNASLVLDDFNPLLYELPFHKEVPGSKTLLSFSSENKEKVFNPGILTSKGVHTFLLSELSDWGPKAFKVIKYFESPMEIFPCSYGEDIRILDVPCLHFYPS